ncbi:MAG: MBL fold metallo-hydrolase [Nitrospiraceae bacterium]|nr:MBL fold metallo-hydrolase [Nitrospiraceae bacterium]
MQIMELPSSDGSQNFSHGTVQFIGTATVLIRYAGLTILTDPNFLHRGEYVHLGYGLRSKRLTEPAMKLDALPPIDLIVLSHLHEDHFDRLVQRQLSRTIPIVTTRKAAQALLKMGFRRTVALKTWEGTAFVKGRVRLKITGMPGRHGPWLLAGLLPPVMGSMLEFQGPAEESLLRLYITGDTLIYEGLKEIPRHFPDIDHMLLHLGGTRVLGVLVTMDAQQGVEAVKLFKPRIAIPIHYNDYTVFKSPLSEFQQQIKSAGLELQVRYVTHGQSFDFLISKSHQPNTRPA